LLFSWFSSRDSSPPFGVKLVNDAIRFVFARIIMRADDKLNARLDLSPALLHYVRKLVRQESYPFA
jgi:hypothetical protein